MAAKKPVAIGYDYGYPGRSHQAPEPETVCLGCGCCGLHEIACRTLRFRLCKSCLAEMKQALAEAETR